MEPSRSLTACLSKALKDEELVPDIASACALAGWDTPVRLLESASEKEVAEKLFLTPQEAHTLLKECSAANEVGAESEGMNSSTFDVKDALTAEAGGVLLEPAQVAGWNTPPESPRSAAAQHEEHEVSVHLAVEARRPQDRAKGFDASAFGGKAGSERLSALRTSCPAVLGAPQQQQQTRDYSHLPSYQRPTVTFHARSKNAPEPIMEEAPVQPIRKAPRRFRNVLAKVLAPTAAFLARVIHRGDRDKKASMPTGESLHLSAVDIILKSPQGQRVTKPMPFALHQSLRLRDSAGQLSTEEMEMAEAQKHAFKSTPTPKHLHEPRPIEGLHQVSTPRRPEEIFEPFNLASQERHTAELARRALELAAQAKEEDEQRMFKARKLNKEMVEKVMTPPKPEPKPVTTPNPPRLLVEERSKHHEAELTPARMARMLEIERVKTEEKQRKAAVEEARSLEQKQREEEELRRATELEKEHVSELRKSLVFKARDLPSFDSVFRPDMTKAPRVTQSAEFKLHTDERLGKPLAWSERRDAAAHQLGSGRYDAMGYADPFASSLRSSTGANARAKAALNLNSRGSSTLSRSVMCSPLGAPPPSSSLARRFGLSASQDLGAALASALRALQGPRSPDSNASTSQAASGTGAAAAAAAHKVAAGMGMSHAAAASPITSAKNSPRPMVSAV